MWLYSIILIAVGALTFYLGFQIKCKQKITLIHNYHWKKVKQQDVKAYTSLMGFGQYAIGVGCFISAILGFFSTTIVTILPLFLGMLVGFAVMYKAQKKYNGGMFS